MPEITAESVMTRMRAAIGHNQKQTAVSGVDGFDCSEIRTEIAAAEAQANVGTEVTPMAQIPAPLRRLARLAGRAVIAVAGFITVGQRSYNTHVIHALSLLTDAVEQAVHVQIARFRREIDAGRQGAVQETLAQLAERNAALEEKLVRQQEALEKATKDLSHLSTALALLERRNAILLGEVGRHLTGPLDQERLQKIAAEGQDSLDTSCVASEGGSRKPQT